MKLRQGRKNGHNLYLQLGDHPDEADPCVGFILDPDVAALIALQVSDNTWVLNEIKIQIEACK